MKSKTLGYTICSEHMQISYICIIIYSNNQVDYTIHTQVTRTHTYTGVRNEARSAALYKSEELQSHELRSKMQIFAKNLQEGTKPL